jgi:hypothetical protein
MGNPTTVGAGIVAAVGSHPIAREGSEPSAPARQPCATAESRHRERALQRPRNETGSCSTSGSGQSAGQAATATNWRIPLGGSGWGFRATKPMVALATAAVVQGDKIDARLLYVFAPPG